MKTKFNNLAICHKSWLVSKYRTLAGCVRGEGFFDTAVKIVIVCVIGALVLFGLYALWSTVIMPRVEQEVTDMFNYTP